MFGTMHVGKENISPVKIQWLLWLFVLAVNFGAILPMDGWPKAAIFAAINTIAYAMTVYGNIFLLLPKLYNKGHRLIYILVSPLFILVIGGFRTLTITWIYDTLFPGDMSSTLSFRTFTYLTTGTFLLFLLSFVFKLALDYFKLKQQAKEIIADKSKAELNLLKSQVQPHFLFNTLNNIYYEAYREAPRTALFIGQLAEIMRYFVDESPKEKVALNAEIQFLENYIALERIRFRYPIDISFKYSCEPATRIPPMLLMTFVENLFKHGIDKSRQDNKVHISLVQAPNTLTFHTYNTLYLNNTYHKGGFGLKNLQERLTLLYGTQYEMQIYTTGQQFHAFLKIPLT
ncbi:sensor histidine kinase [Chitinophaga pendula]|uniref:sensor histidine kinase n=1 Tax=Chitinophaga TaxID=79328 RepID=UPI000BAEFD74|nr:MULTISPECIES: sensor histidine kinase [Chitinophaga]ASZ11679.1 hypothetical protein CK934_12260 [Chitinophaga sp. MD30]UCJ05308.1 sensor histidine kinase [Chitinophaga pendula]